MRIRIQDLKLEQNGYFYDHFRMSSRRPNHGKFLYENRLANKWNKGEEIVLGLRPMSRDFSRTSDTSCSQYKYSAGTPVSEDSIKLSIASGYIQEDFEKPVKDTLYHFSGWNCPAIQFLVQNGQNQYYGLQTTIGNIDDGPDPGPTRSELISSELIKILENLDSGHKYNHIFVIDKDMNFSVSCPKESKWKWEFPFSVFVAVVPYQGG